MSPPESARRALFGAVANLSPPDLERWLSRYLDGLAETYGHAFNSPRRKLLQDTAREWLRELRGPGSRQ